VSLVILIVARRPIVSLGALLGLVGLAGAVTRRIVSRLGHLLARLRPLLFDRRRGIRPMLVAVSSRSRHQRSEGTLKHGREPRL